MGASPPCGNPAHLSYPCPADPSLVLYIAYFPRAPALARENTTEAAYAAKVADLRVERRKGYAVAWVCLLHL